MPIFFWVDNTVEEHPPHAVLQFVDRRYAEVMTRIKDVAYHAIMEEFGECYPQVLDQVMLKFWQEYVRNM